MKLDISGFNRKKFGVLYLVIIVLILELNAKNGWVKNTFVTGADCQGLASMYCGYMIGAWTVGYPGTCVHGGDYGFLIGDKYKKALLEVLCKVTQSNWFTFCLCFKHILKSLQFLISFLCFS